MITRCAVNNRESYISMGRFARRKYKRGRWRYKRVVETTRDDSLKIDGGRRTVSRRWEISCNCDYADRGGQAVDTLTRGRAHTRDNLSTSFQLHDVERHEKRGLLDGLPTLTGKKSPQHMYICNMYFARAIYKNKTKVYTHKHAYVHTHIQIQCNINAAVDAARPPEIPARQSVTVIS